MNVKSMFRQIIFYIPIIKSKKNNQNFRFGILFSQGGGFPPSGGQRKLAV